MALKPRTRKEFLIADFIDKDTPDIVPKTRSEMFLKQMLDKSSKPSWNDLTDKPFGDNEDGTVKTIDPKYLPEGSGGGGGLPTLCFTCDLNSSNVTSDTEVADALEILGQTDFVTVITAIKYEGKTYYGTLKSIEYDDENASYTLSFSWYDGDFGIRISSEFGYFIPMD